MVQAALTVLGAVLDPAAARRPCAAYLTGLSVAANTTVRGLNRACARTTDPACVPRGLTEGPGDGQALHDPRLAGLPQAPPTRDSPRGVMAMAMTLGTHAGTRLAEVGWCGDQAAQRRGMAHEETLAPSGCPSGAHAPIAGRRVQKREAWAAAACNDHPRLGLELLDDAIQRAIPGDSTWARSVTSAQSRNHSQSPPRA